MATVVPTVCEHVWDGKLYETEPPQQKCVRCGAYECVDLSPPAGKPAKMEKKEEVTTKEVSAILAYAEGECYSGKQIAGVE